MTPPSLPTPIRRKRPQLAEEAADYLRAMIIYGHLRSGEFIRLDAVAREFGSSVTPIREALLTLRLEGFVELEPRRGFVVSPFSADDIKDVFGLQAHIAGELAARAATRMTAPTLALLETIQDGLEALHDESQASEADELNTQFHRAVNLAAGSPKLASFLRTAVRYVPTHFYNNVVG